MYSYPCKGGTAGRYEGLGEEEIYLTLAPALHTLFNPQYPTRWSQVKHRNLSPFCSSNNETEIQRLNNIQDHRAKDLQSETLNPHESHEMYLLSPLL